MLGFLPESIFTSTRIGAHKVMAALRRLSVFPHGFRLNIQATTVVMQGQYFERINNCWTKFCDKSEEKHVHGIEKE